MNNLHATTRAQKITLPESNLSLFGCKLSTTLWCHLGISACDLADATPHILRSWLIRIERLLMRERNRGLGRHFRYDLNRHIALADAKRAINARLRMINED